MTLRWLDAKLMHAALWLRHNRLKIAAIVGLPILLIGYHQYTLNTAVAKTEASFATAVAEAEAKAYGQFGVEVFTLATVLVGEAKGQPEEWPDMATAFFARVDDPRWANSVERVAKEGCEVVALCDDVPEYLTSDIGRKAIVFAREALTAYYASEFVPTHGGHSWATPKAAEGHRYFEGLDVVAEGSGHKYFDDRVLAPERSIRPKPKPVPSPRTNEQFLGEATQSAIALAIAEATE